MTDIAELGAVRTERMARAEQAVLAEWIAGGMDALWSGGLAQD